jgi:hypothetical protein
MIIKESFHALPGMERLIEMQHTIPHNLIYSFMPEQETVLWTEMAFSAFC